MAGSPGWRETTRRRIWPRTPCSSLACKKSWAGLAIANVWRQATCRESGLDGDDEAAHLADDAVQQFGVWEVAGLGLAVAFRGTASLDDVVIDANIAPVPLGNPPGSRIAVCAWRRACREVSPES